MVGVCLFGQVRLVYIHSVVFIIVVFKVGKAEAACILAVAVMAAGTAAAETNFGGFDALTKGIVVNEPETVWDSLGVNLIDDGDWVGLVSGKRADLAPVTVGLFIFSVSFSVMEEVLLCGLLHDFDFRNLLGEMRVVYEARELVTRGGLVNPSELEKKSCERRLGLRSRSFTLCLGR